MNPVAVQFEMFELSDASPPTLHATVHDGGRLLAMTMTDILRDSVRDAVNENLIWKGIRNCGTLHSNRTVLRCHR